jgi:pyruvate/2-oxoglutarate dehydrogenase complex dihydrolipoamide acyltransferase (E2) component
MLADATCCPPVTPLTSPFLCDRNFGFDLSTAVEASGSNDAVLVGDDDDESGQQSSQQSQELAVRTPVAPARTPCLRSAEPSQSKALPSLHDGSSLQNETTLFS